MTLVVTDLVDVRQPRAGREILADRRTMPAVSVLIVNYNGGHDLIRCLDLLSRTDYDNYHVIVVDNGSTDGSADDLPYDHPDVRVIRSEENLGFAGGNNLAACHAAGDYLAFLNPDTVVERGWLSHLVRALEQDEQVGLATSKVLLMNAPDRINACGNAMHITGLTLCRGTSCGAGAYGRAEDVAAVSGAAFVIRRDLFEALGGFDEDFFLYMEDTDLSLRARLAGYICRYVPDSIVYHDYTLRFGPRKVFYQERNRALMLLKALRLRTLLALLPALVLGEVVTWGFALLLDRGRLTDKLEAYGWLLTHRREILAKRRATQALREVRDRDLLASTTHRLDLGQIGGGPVFRLAQLVLNPAFFLLRRLSLALVRR
jgi:hypothetical protein